MGLPLGIAEGSIEGGAEVGSGLGAGVLLAYNNWIPSFCLASKGK